MWPNLYLGKVYFARNYFLNYEGYATKGNDDIEHF